MMRKKIVSLCMALVLCLSLLPVTALAAEGAPNTLYVGNTNVNRGGDITYWSTNDSGGLTWVEKATDNSDDWNVKYDPNTATLTLNGATINGAHDATSLPYGSGIYALCSSNQSVALTIELIGTNTIKGNYGIYVDAQQGVTVGTNASLLIQNSDDDGSLEVSGSSYGIYVKSGTGDASLTIKNASVDAKTTQIYSSYAGVCVQSGASTTDSPNISLSVNGGSLTASASEGNDGIQFYVGNSSASATTSLTVSENAIVDARNGGISASGISETLPTPKPTGENSSGIVFDGSTGTVYGSVTLQEDLTIGEGESLTIPDGSSLNCNGKLTNNGTILASGGTVTGSLSDGSTVTTPSISQQPTGQTVTEGSAAMFSVTASAGDSETPTYQWQQSTDNGGSWANIESATSAKYTTEATTTSMSGNQYRCVVTGSGVSVISAPATLTVNAAATTITTQPSNVTVTEGETATFSVTATGSNLTYQWQQSTDGSAWANISGATSSSYTTQAATMDMDGWQYRCVVTDGNSNGVTSQAATLTVTAATVSVTGVSLDKTELSLTVGDTETLTATVAPANAANQSVTWASSAPSVATVDAAGKVTAVGAGTATITVTTVDGGKTAACTVTVRPDIPPANPNYRITVEATQGGTVTADPTAAKASATVTLTPVPDRGYQVGTVAVTDRFGEAVAVTEQAGGTYTFTMPNGQVTVTVTFEAAPLPFPDVTEGDWFYDAVRYAYETGLMDGVGDNRFAPNSETTRAQLVTILYRLAGQPEPGGDSGFSDVAAGTWYTDAVAWAAENGIVNGVSETEFAPGEDITREQLAAILYRYAACQGYDVSQRADLSGFGDASSISGYAQEALSWAHAQGLVLGFEDGSLRPQGNANRAQIAAVLMRFLAAVPTA